MDSVFFSSFGESQWLGAPGEFLVLGRDREDFLSPTTSFESSDVDLLGSWGGWQTPGVGGFVLEL